MRVAITLLKTGDGKDQTLKSSCTRLKALIPILCKKKNLITRRAAKVAYCLVDVTTALKTLRLELFSRQCALEKLTLLIQQAWMAVHTLDKYNADLVDIDRRCPEKLTLPQQWVVKYLEWCVQRHVIASNTTSLVRTLIPMTHERRCEATVADCLNISHEIACEQQQALLVAGVSPLLNVRNAEGAEFFTFTTLLKDKLTVGTHFFGTSHILTSCKQLVVLAAWDTVDAAELENALADGCGIFASAISAFPLGKHLTAKGTARIASLQKQNRRKLAEEALQLILGTGDEQDETILQFKNEFLENAHEKALPEVIQSHLATIGNVQQFLADLAEDCNFCHNVVAIADCWDSWGITGGH